MPNQIDRTLPGAGGIVCEECPACSEPNYLANDCVNVVNYNKCMAGASGIPTTPTGGLPVLSTCDWTSEILSNGACTKCSVCQEPDGTGNACKNVSDYSQCKTKACDFDKEILGQSGQCEICPVCNSPNADGTQCVQKPDYNMCMNTACDWNTNIINSVTKNCEKCAVCEKPDWFKTKCFRDANYQNCMATACDWESNIIEDGQCKKCNTCYQPD